MDVHPTKNGINRYWSIPMFVGWGPFLWPFCVRGSTYFCTPSLARPSKTNRVQRAEHQKWIPKKIATMIRKCWCSTKNAIKTAASPEKSPFFNGDLLRWPMFKMLFQFAKCKRWPRRIATDFGRLSIASPVFGDKKGGSSHPAFDGHLHILTIPMLPMAGVDGYVFFLKLPRTP